MVDLILVHDCVFNVKDGSTTVYFEKTRGEGKTLLFTCCDDTINTVPMQVNKIFWSTHLQQRHESFSFFNFENLIDVYVPTKTNRLKMWENFHDSLSEQFNDFPCH